MEQEDDDDQGHDEAFLDQRVGQRLDRAVDQRRPVVDDGIFHSLRQALHRLVQAGLNALDDLPGVHAIANDHDPADRLAFAVQLGNAAAHVGSDLHIGHLTQQDRRATGTTTHGDLPEILDALCITADAEHEFLFAHLDRTAAHLGVAVLHGHGDLADREVVGVQAMRIDGDLVLLHVPANRRDLGDALDAGELVAQEPILHGTQLGQVVLFRVERIHERPADPGGVGPEPGRDLGGQFARDAVEILQHPAARPIGIGPVLKDHIDEGKAVKRIAPHHLGFGHRQHLGGDGVGELILHDLRRLARPLGIDDDLGVGQVGDRIEGDVFQ